MSDDLVNRLRQPWDKDRSIMSQTGRWMTEREDAADRIEELQGRVEAAEAKLAEALPYDVRQWYYYPIEMPLTKEGQGPAKIGVDADRVYYEVWDVLLNAHASFDNLPDAINESMRLNNTLAELKGKDDEC